MLGPRVVVSIHVMYPRVVMIINLYTFRYVEVVIRYIDTLYMYVYKHMHARKYIHTRTHNARMHNAYTHMHASTHTHTHTHTYVCVYWVRSNIRTSTNDSVTFHKCMGTYE